MATAVSARPTPFLRRARIQGFRSIVDTKIMFGPLTVLLGLNGAGKSNVIDALRFVQDVVRTSPAQAIEDRQGLSTVLHRGSWPAGRLRIELELGISPRPGQARGDALPLPLEPMTAIYGFELRLDEATDLGTHIEREWCQFTGAEAAGGFAAEEGRVVTGPAQLMGPVADPTTLVLPTAARLPPLAMVYSALRGMAFHALSPSTMRLVGQRSKRSVLGPSGEQLPQVLDALATQFPHARRRIDDYLAAILPGALGIETFALDEFHTVRLRMAEPSADGGVQVFPAQSMSDGTLAATGLLASLFQTGTWMGTIPLVVVEDPELGLHAGAVGALFSALAEASEHVQVVVATQSADLLDQKNFPLDAARIVELRNGTTVVTEVDDRIREIVRRDLGTLGELQRSNQLTPWPEPPDTAW
ncbi:AAA family ATPase [Frankia sp. CiP3]|uniref:AAA family ATPase n=1 Tax=Frankia sp. CiP3 TaxID=2880971 RepID=UPI001EF461B6|nr:AAA family ATPase [Frankia sp. CiP3]